MSNGKNNGMAATEQERRVEAQSHIPGLVEIESSDTDQQRAEESVAEGEVASRVCTPFRPRRGRGYSVVALYNPKNNLNVGSAIRACSCYGSAAMFIGGPRNKYRPAPTDTPSGYRHMPVVLVDDLHEAIPYDCVPVAVDLIDGARPLHKYTHPERAFYVFGPEDGTLGKSITSWCRDTIYVPTNGCMNLAASVNVVLYDRLAKGLS